MTSASELFYNRRSRLGRSDPDFGSDPSLDRIFPHHHHHHHQSHSSHRRHRHHNGHHQHRHDSDGCDPLRRAPHLRQVCHRVPISERSSIRNDQGTSQYISRNNANVETQRSTSRGSLTGNERLPGAVLLARARLLERLRGVSLSGNRRSDRASSANHQRESTLDNDFRIIDSTDWVSFFPELTFQLEGPQLYQEHSKKPCGLTEEALNNLQRQVFSSTKVNNETRDCSICLESFTDGDMLTCLPCSHGFHSSCLDPWVRTCGECPCCRRAILLSGKDLK